MKKALILINAYTQNGHELNQPLRLKEELASLGVAAEILRNGDPALLENGDMGYDFCVFFDKDRAVSHLLEGRGMRLFNSADAIETCDDKMRTYLALEGKFPMPETIPVPLCYTPAEPVSEAFLRAAVGRLGLPLVVKENFGSLGSGVHLAKTHEELRRLAEELKLKACCLQRFIAESAGRDIRVIVVGGRALVAMKRTNAADFRSNLEHGGVGEPHPLDGDVARLAEAVAREIGLDYCGIDLLSGNDGPLVCEVNSNAFFGGIEKVTGVNVARAYAEHICRVMYP